MVKPQPVLPLRAVSGCMALQQRGVCVDVCGLAHVTTKGHADVPDLGCRLGPSDVSEG